MRPATISTAIMVAMAARKPQSTIITGTAPSGSSPATASRPASHRTASAISGVPRAGIRPVQFGTAVNRKPAITAAA